MPVREEPYQLLPGDSFRTNCYYKGGRDSVFGLGSRDEMCISFLYYYPRKTISIPTPDGNFTLPYMCGLGLDFMENACNAQYTAEVLESEAGLDRQFGKQKAQCLLSTSQASQVDMSDKEEVDAPEGPSTEPIEPGSSTETATESTASESNVPPPEMIGDVEDLATVSSADWATPVTGTFVSMTALFLAAFAL